MWTAITNKRNREEQIKIYERMKRDRDEYLKDPLFTRVIWKDPFFEFVYETKKKEIDNLTATMKNAASMNQLEDIEKCTRELYYIIKMYPKVCTYLKKDDFKLLVGFLKNELYPNLQSLVAIILQSVFANSRNGNMVIEYITSELLVKLISSNHGDVHVQALELLHSITMANPGPEFKANLEEALGPLTVLLFSKLTDDQVLHSSSKALAAICLVYPELPPDKLKTVLNGLVNILKHKSEEFMNDACSRFHYLWDGSHRKILLNACLGFQYLCDGRKNMFLEKEYFEPLYEALIILILLWDRNGSHEIPVAALNALGSIVRCSDRFIEFMIDRDQLSLIVDALEQEELHFVKIVCWIFSNITAAETNQLKDVVCTKLIAPLVRVVQSYKYVEAKEEALWALLNAIYGVGSDDEQLKKQCIKPLWKTLKTCWNDEQIVYLCLVGLIKLEGVEIKCNDVLLDGKQFIYFLLELYGGFTSSFIRQFIQGKKLRRFYSYSDIYENRFEEVVFRLCTCEVENEETPIFLWCEFSGSTYCWLNSSEGALPSDLWMSICKYSSY